MLRVLTSSSRALKFALVFSILATMFAVSAYANTTPWNEEDGAQTGVDNVGAYLTDAQGTKTNRGESLSGATITKDGDNNYVIKHVVGLVNNGNINLTVGLLASPYVGEGITVTSMSAKALGDAPPANPGFSGSNAPFAPPERWVFGEFTGGAQEHLAPGKTILYEITMNATVSSQASANYLDCDRSNDNSNGSYKTGFNIFLNGVAGDDTRQWGVGITAYSCADISNVVASTPTTTVTTSPQVSQSEDAVTQDVAPPVVEPVEDQLPASTPVLAPISADRPAVSNSELMQGTQSQNESELRGEKPISAQNSETSQRDTELFNDAIATQDNKLQVAEKQKASVPNLAKNLSSAEDAQRSSNEVNSELFNEVAIKSTATVKSSETVIGSIPSQISHAKTSNSDSQYLILAALASISAACFAAGLRKNRQKTKLISKEVFDRESDFASLEGFAVSSRRVYDTELRFIDVYGAHEAGKRKARAKAAMPVVAPISKVASKARPEHPRFDLAMRIWNELMKRTTKQKEKVYVNR